MSRRAVSRSAVILAVLLLAACHKHPVGQVVAVIDDDEVTRAELNAELAAGGDSGPHAASNALHRLIERRLLARAARNLALDKSQDYLIRSRQLNDALLGQLLREQAAQTLPPPDQPGPPPIERDRQVERLIQQRLALERARSRIERAPGLDGP